MSFLCVLNWTWHVSFIPEISLYWEHNFHKSHHFPQQKRVHRLPPSACVPLALAHLDSMLGTCPLQAFPPAPFAGYLHPWAPEHLCRTPPHLQPNWGQLTAELELAGSVLSQRQRVAAALTYGMLQVPAELARFRPGLRFISATLQFWPCLSSRSPAARCCVPIARWGDRARFVWCSLSLRPGFG